MMKSVFVACIIDRITQKLLRTSNRVTRRTARAPAAAERWKGQNSSTISQLERAQQKPDPSSPKRRKNETEAETTGRQRIGKAPLNLRCPEATHSQREHTDLMDRGRGFEPICRARRVRKRAAPPLSVQRLEVPREPEREWRRVLMVRTPNTEVCICHSRCFKEI